MDEAMQLEPTDGGADGRAGKADEAGEASSASLWEHTSRRPVVALLPDGSWHSCCPGHYCPYRERDGEGQFVCKYTGVVHQVDIDGHSEWYDLNGGTGRRMDDAENHQWGADRAKVVRHARTRSRRDAVQRSLEASRHAMTVDDEFENRQWKHNVAAQSQQTRAGGVRAPGRRRVALCVDVHAGAPETTRDAASLDTSSAWAAREDGSGDGNVDAAVGAVHEVDRVRIDVRNPHFHGPPAQLAELFREVKLVMHRLINYREAASYRQPTKSGHPGAHAAASAPKPQDAHAEWLASVRKYAKECLTRGVAPSIDAVHNLELMVHASKAAARSERAAQQKAAAIRTVRFREACSNLVVGLWRACCNTAHLRNARRGNDSFRPFVCGVLYAFKRGLVLANGSVLVPQCPLLAAALPVLGSTGGNTVAKTLHSSSHRGMCTLMRCIASVPPEKQNAQFADVVACAAQFAATRFAATDI